METKEKKCSTCKYLQRYYVKSVLHFHATEFGYCIKKQEIIGAHDCCCERYAYKTPKRYNRLLIATLNDLLTEISEIRGILDGEQEHGKNV